MFRTILVVSLFSLLLFALASTSWAQCGMPDTCGNAAVMSSGCSSCNVGGCHDGGCFEGGYSDGGCHDGGCHDGGCNTCAYGDPKCGCSHGKSHAASAKLQMPLHYQYYPALHGYYYFRPYHHSHLTQHQEIVSRWGGNSAAPYANKIFEEIYAQYQAEHPQR